MEGQPNRLELLVYLLLIKARIRAEPLIKRNNCSPTVS
jgi:hypothetical protein